MTIKSFFYDHFVAGRYDRELAEITDHFRTVLFDRVGIQPGDVVLDLGCGTGLNQPHLAERVGEQGRVVGIDASAQMLAQARARAESGGYGDRLTLIHGDARQVNQLVDVVPDVVIATLIFSVLPDWRNVFARTFEMLKSGGQPN